MPTATTAATGLTAAQVAERVAAGKVNRVDQQTSRPLSAIIRSNVLTRFNAILGAMLVVILIVGPSRTRRSAWSSSATPLIGIVQEVRAKRTLDRLAVLNAPPRGCVRDGASAEIAVGEVVLDDLLGCSTGDQVPADGVVLAAPTGWRSTSRC